MIKLYLLRTNALPLQCTVVTDGTESVSAREKSIKGCECLDLLAGSGFEISILQFKALGLTCCELVHFEFTSNQGHWLSDVAGVDIGQGTGIDHRCGQEDQCCNG